MLPHPFPATLHDRSLDALLALLELRGIDDRCVLAAVTVVPRERFRVHPGEVYDSARRVEALELVGDEHVLQVGVGSGYATALLSLLSAHVYATEEDLTVEVAARERLDAIDYDRVTYACRPAAEGWAKHAPYDAIFVTDHGHDEVPPALGDQLAVGGRIVMVLRGRLVRATKRSDGELIFTDLGPAPVVEGN